MSQTEHWCSWKAVHRQKRSIVTWLWGTYEVCASLVWTLFSVAYNKVHRHDSWHMHSPCHIQHSAKGGLDTHSYKLATSSFQPFQWDDEKCILRGILSKRCRFMWWSCLRFDQCFIHWTCPLWSFHSRCCLQCKIGGCLPLSRPHACLDSCRLLFVCDDSTRHVSDLEQHLINFICSVFSADLNWTHNYCATLRFLFPVEERSVPWLSECLSLCLLVSLMMAYTGTWLVCDWVTLLPFLAIILQVPMSTRLLLEANYDLYNFTSGELQVIAAAWRLCLNSSFLTMRPTRAISIGDSINLTDGYQDVKQDFMLNTCIVVW